MPTPTPTPTPKENQKPIADAGDDKVATVNETVKIRGKGTDSDGTIVKYEWLKDEEEVVGDTATITYTPKKTGRYTFTLTVTDDDGATDSDDMVLIVVEGGSTGGNNGGDDYYQTDEYYDNQ